MGAGRGDREPVLGKQSGGAGEGGQLPGQADQPERRGQAPLPHGPAIKGRIPPARLPARSPTSGKCTSHLGFGLVFTWTVRDGYHDNNGILGLPDSLRDAGNVIDGSGNALTAGLHQYWHFYYQRVDARAKPARPYNLTATPGDGEVMLSWGDPGDESITKYRFRGDGSGRGWQGIPGSDAKHHLLHCDWPQQWPNPTSSECGQ